MISKISVLITVIPLILGITACSSSLQEQKEDFAKNDILFQDDFSTAGNWDVVKDANGETNYQDESYHILVNDVNTDVWANPGLNFSDVRVEVDATKIRGPEDNEFGVICRHTDVHNFYYFAISSDGYFGIFKVKNGNNLLLNRTEMLPSTSIKGGADLNHLRADCVGSLLTFYVNGEILDQQEDSEFTSGDVGLIAGTYAESGVEILFDNFIVMRPEQ